jgi:hypothetical protein
MGEVRETLFHVLLEFVNGTRDLRGKIHASGDYPEV